MDNQPTPTEIETTLKVLRLAAADVSRFDSLLEFKTLVAKVNRLARQRHGREVKQQMQTADWQTKTAALESRAARVAPEIPLVLHKSRHCYICKTPYRVLDGLYHLLCADCATFNLKKRRQRCDLGGRVALITGGRIKIGFEIALKLLRDGARVILTTRFPRDAEQRFMAQADCADWSAQLELHGLDLRHLAAVQGFIAGLLECEPHLDILINNAAQTISRPLDFFAHLLESENTVLPSELVRSPMQFFGGSLEVLPFAVGQLDADGQALDLRVSNSWVQKLDQVPTRDLLEVQVVNFIAPFMFCSQLKPLFERSPFASRFIVNVSAMEGQFSRLSKGVHHPHSNAAKAALNMLTRTSGADYARSQIYMTAVDTGWITDENPFPKATRMRQKQSFVPPLDAVDGAARIYDPIASTLNQPNPPFFGVFLKDYKPYPW